jgi:membrane-associated phospholipid phosphatase
MDRPEHTRLPRLGALALAAACAAAVLPLWYASVATPLGARLDVDAHASYAATDAGLADSSSTLLATISAGSLALGLLALVALALARRSPASAIGAAAIVIGANVTTQLGKATLDSSGGFAADPVRELTAAFPSGHTTVAASLGLALVLVAGSRFRRWAAAAAALYATGVGVAVVALGWHYPSDVLGAYLVAGAWAGGAALLVARSEGRARRPRAARPRPWTDFALPGALGLMALGAAVAVARQPQPATALAFVDANTSFTLAAGVIAAAAVGLMAAYAALVEPLGASGGEAAPAETGL